MFELFLLRVARFVFLVLAKKRFFPKRLIFKGGFYCHFLINSCGFYSRAAYIQENNGTCGFNQVKVCFMLNFQIGKI